MKYSWLILFSSILFFSCKRNEEPLVEFQTTEGTFIVKLYKETPQHRDNMVKLVKDGFYDGQLFYKISTDLSIETGDPNSKTASRNRLLGENAPEYTIPAEINYPHFFHKKGVLSAIRQTDAKNPDKASNGTQFCIVHGRKFSSAELDTIEQDIYNHQLDIIWQKLVVKNRSKIDQLSLRSNDHQKLEALQDSLVGLAEKELKKHKPFQFTAAERKAYTTIGGNPAMDNEFTIFGEVVSGMDVIDKITKLNVDRDERPLKDVRIIKATLK